MTCLKSIRIEFHILQSFPATCLNRDDVGAPKTANIGGVPRARVPSQCWKREVRKELHDFGIQLGLRTKKIASILKSKCIKLGANEEKAKECADHIAKIIGDETLLFISKTEARAFAKYAQALDFDYDRIKLKDLSKIAKRNLNPAEDALDIALFGRMVAKVSEMDIQAAASFNHAISTHAVSNEIDFFTAIDDLKTEKGSAHMGSIEFNSATYYRYVSLDLGQLAQSFGSEDMKADPDQLKTAIDAFVKALYLAIPPARQATQSGACHWDFAKVLVRKGQRLQVSFEKPVTSSGEGYLLPSIEALKSHISQKESMIGSLFNKLGDYEWGENPGYSLDMLISDLQKHVEQ
ncbi:type I-E CRISPR-associated protein Cas7/Cse4/CasC [Photobacterium leiognathi]|uniref:type I-E CRISPR-associated protein Cas7/Cse4/CasC n=1 Tax=Photobacterium leiognathi TaxID=553611 RepID=UPI001EDCB092|nr:type I-E CRISPR-associated protein Cas7/Cse4/CasC [Photobacterium leiognathi]MCG3884487.1 type I-E CRISPR-associated protein Cas7/Cse4/CasC [Photobacterium leiognathi]